MFRPAAPSAEPAERVSPSSAPVSGAAGSGSNRGHVDRSSEEEQGLDVAAVNLVNKYSQQVGAALSVSVSLSNSVFCLCVCVSLSLFLSLSVFLFDILSVAVFVIRDRFVKKLTCA